MKPPCTPSPEDESRAQKLTAELMSKGPKTFLFDHLKEIERYRDIVIKSEDTDADFANRVSDHYAKNALLELLMASIPSDIPQHVSPAKMEVLLVRAAIGFGIEYGLQLAARAIKA